jgi:2'-5' RNA ligase
MNLWIALQQIYGAPQGSELGVTPHISLVVFPHGEPSAFEATIKSISECNTPFEITLDRADHFPGSEGVVFLAPQESNPLREIQRLLFKSMDPKHRENCSPYYLPANWIPHCTVAVGVPENKIAPVKKSCLDNFPGKVTVKAIRGATYRPSIEQYKYSLRQSP